MYSTVPVIAFVNPKGGAGKSTAAVVLATQLALKGAGVVILDADPNKPVSRWAKQAGCPNKITVVANISEASIIDDIQSARQQKPFVVVDLEGTASMTVAYSIGWADLVIIPMQGSQLDAAQGSRAITLIRQQEKAFSRTIPYAVLFTRTSSAIRPRTLVHIQEEFRRHDIRCFRTQMHEREAFRALFSFGGTLEGLDRAQVSNVDNAISNAHAFAAEVVAMLNETSHAPSPQNVDATSKVEVA